MTCNINFEDEPWITFLWNIENYSFCWQKRGHCIESPVFNVESTNWMLALYPRIGKNENFVSYAIYGSCRDDSINFPVEWELAILGEEDSIMQINERVPINIIEFNNWNLVSFVKQDDVAKLRKEALLQDILRIRCRLWRSGGKTIAPTIFLARTILKVEEMNFTWNIKQFSSLELNREVTYAIKSESQDDDLAILKIEANEECKIIINIKSFDHKVRFSTFKLFIKDTNDYKIDCGKCEIWSFDIHNEAKYTLPFTKKDLIENENLYLKNDVLSVYCEYSWCTGYAFERIEKLDLGSTSPCISN